MNQLFLDSNIWVRYAVQEPEGQAHHTHALIDKIEEGMFKPYTSSFILLEVFYVLTKYYGVSKEAAFQFLEKIQKVRNIVVIETTDINRAFNLYRKYSIKLSDCIIAAQITQKQTLVTYDKEFRKIDSLNVQSPEEII